MNRMQAYKIDRSFYVDFDSQFEIYCVFGAQTDFVYSTHLTEEEANAAAIKIKK